MQRHLKLKYSRLWELPPLRYRRLMSQAVPLALRRMEGAQSAAGGDTHLEAGKCDS